jgi:hypothetical protein
MKRRTPVELTIDLKNNSNESKLVSFQLALARKLSLDKGGLKNMELKQLGQLKPFENKRFYFEIFPKMGIVPADYPIKLQVLEHYESYKYVAKKITKNISLKVED